MIFYKMQGVWGHAPPGIFFTIGDSPPSNLYNLVLSPFGQNAERNPASAELLLWWRFLDVSDIQYDFELCEPRPQQKLNITACQTHDAGLPHNYTRKFLKNIENVKRCRDGMPKTM